MQSESQPKDTSNEPDMFDETLRRLVRVTKPEFDAEEKKYLRMRKRLREKGESKKRGKK